MEHPQRDPHVPPLPAAQPYFSDRGAGPPLLLIHGLMASGAMFEHVVERLATRHRVIVPDLRGHGRSRGVPGPYTVANVAADLPTLLDRLGIESAAVVGYSQGGAVAQQFALAYPRRCHRLVLACTYAFNMASLREQCEGRLAPILVRLLGMPRFARLVVGQGMQSAPAQARAGLIDMIGGQDRAAMIESWKLAMEFDSRPRLRELRCPTLVLAGAEDTAVPMHHARMLLSGIAGARLHVVDDAGHGLIWTHPEAFVRAVEDFLAPTPED